ncbi:YkvA family protein [Rufibacter aurantiacus]|uniref:YkvA family protein n=1 Tax=Rufibacter aurantiacus TaxID=2817374 RepID=UPI0031F55D36
MWQKLKTWAKRLKADVWAVALAIQDARTPWPAKAMGALTVAYALSPVDLIPDFIPVLGYVDDLLLLPLGVWLTIKLLPADIMEEYRQKIALEGRPRFKHSKWAAAVIILLWALALWWAGSWAWRWYQNR